MVRKKPRHGKQPFFSTVGYIYTLSHTNGWNLKENASSDFKEKQDDPLTTNFLGLQKCEFSGVVGLSYWLMEKIRRAPVDMVNIQLFARFYTSQVVHDFFEQ